MNAGSEQGFNRMLASRLRPGSSLDDVKAAWGSRWSPPGPKDRGYIGLFAKLGAHVRLDTRDRVAEVGFAPNFPPKYAIEGLRIGMTLAEMKAARPGLRAPDPPDPELAKTGRTDFFETLGDGCELRVAVQKEKVAAVVLSRPGAEYPAEKRVTTSRQYPSPAAPAAPFADPNLKLGVLAALLRKGIIELGEPVELASHLRGEEVDADDLDYLFHADIHEYLASYPLTTAQLESVDELWLDRGTDVIESFVWPNFDGETDELDVRSLARIAHCPNVRDFSIATHLPVDLSPLADLAKLESVWIGEGASVTNARVLLELPSLNWVRLSGATDLTAGDIAALKLRKVEVAQR